MVFLYVNSIQPCICKFTNISDQKIISNNSELKGSVYVPGNPGSALSPASQSAEEQAYLEKLKQLSKYIDPLKRMIKKTEKQDGKSVIVNQLKQLSKYMSHAVRKPVFAICEQQRCRSAYTCYIQNCKTSSSL